MDGDMAEWSGQNAGDAECIMTGVRSLSVTEVTSVTQVRSLDWHLHGQLWSALNEWLFSLQLEEDPRWNILVNSLELFPDHIRIYYKKRLIFIVTWPKTSYTLSTYTKLGL